MSGPHVLLVTPGFPPARGGVEEHVGRIAAELVGLGVRVSVLTARRGLTRTVVEDHDGVRVVVCPAWRSAALSVSPTLLVRALAAHDADVLHVHSYHALTGLAVLNRRLRGRVVFTPHFHGGGHTPLARLLHLGYRRLATRLFAAADAVVCVSEAERALLEADVPAVVGKTTVIPNGVAVDRVRAVTPYADEPPTALVVGRLEPYKGVAAVLDAFARIPVPAQLVVVGDGSERAALVERAGRAGLGERVRFVGTVETPELHRWLRTARVLVSASRHEAFGMAPLEAAAAGASVVLSDIPAHAEIAARYLGSAATLVDPADPAALASAMEVRLAAPDRVEVTVPTWREVAESTLVTYERVLAAVPSARSAPPVDGRRVNLLDRPWSTHWSVCAVAPVQAPSLDQLRATLLRFLEQHPDDALACTVDPLAGRWRPVAPADRLAHVARLVQPGEPLDPSDVDGYLARHRPPADTDLVFTCVLAERSIVVFSRHQHGDGATFANQVFALVSADVAALAALEPRGRVTTVARAVARQPRAVYAGWARRALSGMPLPGRTGARPVPPAEPTTPAPVRPGPGAVGPASADHVLTNADVRALTAWRNAHARGVSVTAVLTARVYAALVAEGVPVRRDAFYSLFDVRPLLDPAAAGTPGNLAKSVLVDTDLADPAAIEAAMRAVMESRRVLPALLVGALGSLRPLPPAASVDGLAAEAVLTFSSMPSLPGLEALPWSSTQGRRYVGLGYPTGPDGISVFAIRFRDRMELTASFDRALAEPAAVTRALARVGTPPPYERDRGPGGTGAARD